jgi:hypothetical protein
MSKKNKTTLLDKMKDTEIHKQFSASLNELIADSSDYSETNRQLLWELMEIKEKYGEEAYKEYYKIYDNIIEEVIKKKYGGVDYDKRGKDTE